jgi:4'-phosphopantetheinyl transferase
VSLHLTWPAAEAPQRIVPEQIHVWAWPLNDPNAADDAALLDTEERTRFTRFRFDRDRFRFAVAHANMRRILGAYLRSPLESIGYHNNAFGKPELAGSEAGGVSVPSLYFNLSHTQSIALLALSLDAEVGIDVEDLHAIEPEVAESHFSARELSDLASLDGDGWLRGFYHCWTRKEAILKAEGVGLNIPLDAFDVSLLPGAPAELLDARPAAALRHRWTLHNLSPTQDTVAALAAGSAHAHVCCFTLKGG